jgi:phosphoribosylaminoimidazole-succinocarboxamide synthase
MEKKEMLYEGKAKRIYATDNPNQVVIYYKDDATAFNALKKDTVSDKGVFNNQITTIIYEYLEHHDIKTHFIAKLNDREQLCEKVTIFPLEFIVRNLAAGSMAKRLGMEEGQALPHVVHEISYKNDALGDPLINDHHAVALGAASFEELKQMYEIAGNINKILQAWLIEKNIILVDFKIEFGKNQAGEILLADEISPDTCRFWDADTKKKLDKDRFRHDLGEVKEAYEEILHRLTKA